MLCLLASAYKLLLTLFDKFKIFLPGKFRIKKVYFSLNLKAYDVFFPVIHVVLQLCSSIAMLIYVTYQVHLLIYIVLFFRTPSPETCNSHW